MSAASERAKRLLRDLKIDRPELLVYLKEICCERGVYVREHPLEASEARLTVSGDRGIITVHPRDDFASRTRFSIAHELGHFELHRQSVACSKRALNDWRTGQEIEANEFASELLMPEEFIRAEIAASRPGFRALERLAERYQTSLFATTRRFIELTDEPCAAVFYRNGVISHSWRSRPFAASGYQLEGTIDRYSFAHDALSGDGAPTQMREVDARAWLEVPQRLGPRTILEQARFFPGLDIGMSILWIHNRSLIGGRRSA